MTSQQQRPIIEYPSVAAWSDSLRRQWGGDPLAEDPAKLEALTAFCAFVGEDPDAIVRHCFRIRKTDGQRVISDKWRAHYAERIKEFARTQPAAESRPRTTAVLGFLIHNGIFIQG